MTMDGRSQRELQLRVMYLEAVHLPVFEETAHDYRARIKQLFAGRTQSRVSRDASIGSQPGVDGTVGNIHMETASENGSSVGDRVAEIEGGDGVEDEVERIGSILAGFSGEAMQAFRALQELQCSQAISALASSCSRLAVAFRTGQI